MNSKPSTSSQAIIASTTPDNIEAEQRDHINNWLRDNIPNESKEFIEDVDDLIDFTNILHVNLAKMGFTKVILVPKRNVFTNDITYEPYFAAVALAKQLGYGRPDDVCRRVLKNHCIKSMVELQLPAISREQIIVPESLNIKEIGQIKFTDFNGAKYLITHVAHSGDERFSKYKQLASKVLNAMDNLAILSKDIIVMLNRLIAGYKHQQQLIAIEASKKEHDRQLALIEADKQEHERKKKQLEEETKLLALKKFPDVIVEKSHYGYIFSSPEYMATNLYKIGITDHLANREQAAKTYCPTGSFIYTMATYDARSTEQVIHQALKKHGLWHEVSAGNEWFYIPSLDEAKKLLDIATNSTTSIYDQIATFASTLRINYSTNPITAPTGRLAIMDAPSIETLISDYVSEVVKHIIDSKATSMSKTNMIQLLRKVAHGPKYRKKKDQLPTDLDTFLSNNGITSQGLSLSKKPTKSTMTIKIEITTDERD